MASLDAKKKAMAMLNGCPLMEGREKMDWASVEGEVLTLEGAYLMSGFYCVIFTETPDSYFFTGKALTEVINEVGPDDAIGLQFKVGKEIKTKNNQSFRPFTCV